MFNYLTLFSVLLTTIVLLLRRWFTYWSRHGVKGAKFVNLGIYTRPSNEVLVEESKKYGRIYGGYHLDRRILTVNEPQLIHDILVKDFPIFQDRVQVTHDGSLISKTLKFVSGKEWKRVRTSVSHVFTTHKINSMSANISQMTDQFIGNLELNRTIDLHKHINALAFDVFYANTNGVSIDSFNNPDHPIVTNFNKISSGNGLSKFISMIAPKLTQLLRLEPCDRSALQYFQDIVKTIVFDGKAQTKECFIQTMIESKNINTNNDIDSVNENQLKSLSKLSTDELSVNSVALFAFGFIRVVDTFNEVITHIVFHVSKDKQIQNKLYEELKDLTDFSFEKLNELQYLNAVINETLRLFPPALSFSRVCSQDYKLGTTGITVPKGTLVRISPYCVHRDPEYWSNPEQFKPERFIESKPLPNTYLPFSIGPRSCVAQRLALNMLKMSLAKLFANFEFNVAPGYKPKFSYEYDQGLAVECTREMLVTITAKA